MFGLDVAHLLATLGYGAVGLLVFIEDFGIPSPGETVLIAAAVGAAQGELNVLLVGTVAFLAAVLGDNVGYAIGRYGGRRLILRMGKGVHVGDRHLVTRGRLDRAGSFFERYGSWVIVMARFIEGMRQLNGIVAGSLQYGWVRFLGLNALGAALWVGFWVSAAHYGGSWLSQMHGRFRWVMVLAGVLIMGGVLLVLYLRTRKGEMDAKSPGKAEEAWTLWESCETLLRPARGRERTEPDPTGWVTWLQAPFITRPGGPPWGRPSPPGGPGASWPAPRR